RDITPAIIPEDDWQEAQEALQRNRKKRHRYGQRECLLRGLVRCGTCGRQFSPVGKKGRVYYVCTSTQNPTLHCKTKSFPAKKHEADVWNEVCKILKGKKPAKRKVY